MVTESSLDSESSSPTESGAGRRHFMKKAACLTLGGAATAGPIAAGVTVLVSPLGEKSTGTGFVRLTTVDGLEPGGPPRLFKVVAERQDAWTRHASTELGSVYLQRVGDGENAADFRAFQSSCPHLGCAVDYKREGHYYCPCHQSSFAMDGSILSASSPSQRGLDSLEVEVRDGEVWVDYKQFRANMKDKIPVA